MNALLISGFLFALAAPGAAEAVGQETVADATPLRQFDWNPSDRRAYAYDRFSANCDTLEHGRGRNAAWGLFRMPLFEVADQGPETDERGAVSLTYRCTDGSDCIGGGSLDQIRSWGNAHAISFLNAEDARSFADQVAQLRARCSRP